MSTKPPIFTTNGKLGPHMSLSASWNNCGASIARDGRISLASTSTHGVVEKSNTTAEF